MNDAARDALRRGLALRRAHEIEAAYAAIADARRLAPDDPQIAAAHAHISYDSWRPAAALFARATALAPDQRELIRAQATALNAEGHGVEADTLLANVLRAYPDWIEGHRALATRRITAGDPAFARSFVEAQTMHPDNAALPIAHFHLLAMARDWEPARRVIADAEARFGPARAIRLARVFLASESDAASRDPLLFDAVGDITDDGLDLCKVRFHLRTGTPEAAIAIAERNSGGRAARTFWPYLALGWRLTGNPRAAWLDGDPPLIGVTDVALPGGVLAALEQVVGDLLVLEAPYPEQSVRGGIQTDRHLFFNPHPIIQQIKGALTAAVHAHIAALPPVTADHPLLGLPRTTPRFEGSWAVRLRQQGHHAAHTHSRGWLSSAFYVAVPPIAPAPAGWIEFGAPPPELGLPLEPFARVEPKPGRLVLFPSTLWHGTVPFASGERLTIAFDVAIPASE